MPVMVNMREKTNSNDWRHFQGVGNYCKDLRCGKDKTMTVSYHMSHFRL